ncbi:hypothetical protein ACXIZN_11630 [Amycolatopsis sp. TRM77291]
MTDEEPISRELAEALEKRFIAIDRWWEIFQDRVDVDPGSPLAGDDRDTAPYQLSHAAQASLLSAIEHLHTIRMLVVKAGALHARSPFTLMRSAIESGATVIWLLRPTLRNERILRRLQLRWADALDREGIINDLGAPQNSTIEKSRQAILDVATRKKMTNDQRSLAIGRKVTYASIVKEAAGPGLSITNPGHIMAIWSLLSGIAHGSQRAQIDLLEKAVLGEVENSVLQVKLQTPEKAFLAILSMAMLVVDDALTLFNRKRSALLSTMY